MAIGAITLWSYLVQAFAQPRMLKTPCTPELFLALSCWSKSCTCGRMAYFWYDDEKRKYMPEDSAKAYDENASTKAEANEAQGQPLAAQANIEIGGSNHSASVRRRDSYYSPGPRNGFIELHVLTMGLADFKVRLEKVEGVIEVTLMDKVKLKSNGEGWGHQQLLQVFYSAWPNTPVEFGLNHWWRTY